MAFLLRFSDSPSPEADQTLGPFDSVTYGEAGTIPAEFGRLVTGRRALSADGVLRAAMNPAGCWLVLSPDGRLVAFRRLDILPAPIAESDLSCAVCGGAEFSHVHNEGLHRYTRKGSPIGDQLGEEQEREAARAGKCIHPARLIFRDVQTRALCCAMCGASLTGGGL